MLESMTFMNLFNTFDHALGINQECIECVSYESIDHVYNALFTRLLMSLVIHNFMYC